MLLRKGKHGEFYGCAAYPKCKYTRRHNFKGIEAFPKARANYIKI